MVLSMCWYFKCWIWACANVFGIFIKGAKKFSSDRCFSEIYNVFCMELESIKPSLDLNLIITKKIIEDEFNDEFAMIDTNILSN